MGAQLIREVATKTNDVAGDGTTTATVLAQAIIREGLKNVAAGANPMVLRTRHCRRLTEAAVGGHQGQRPSLLSGTKDIARVGTISSGDEQIGKLIAEAMEKVGRRRRHHRGRVQDRARPIPRSSRACSLTAATSPPTWSPIPRRWKPSSMTPYILITDKKISNIQEILPLLEQIVQGRQEARHHRRGGRGRSARHHASQQAARHVHLRVRQGPGLRRPPQGNACRISPF